MSMQTTTETPSTAAHEVPVSRAAQCVILHGISWETYERLLAEHQDSSGTHFTYDQGRLEIMVLSARHERPNRALALLVEMFAEEKNIEVENLGSTTFKREDVDRGFEPDSCFYVQNAERIREKDEIDLTVDPPPDLVIEIDITSPSLKKFPIFAALGIPEVWRYDGKRVSIWRLSASEYVESADSAVLPGITTDTLNQLLVARAQMKRVAWGHHVRQWVRQHGN